MIILINGSFAVGNTTVAEQLDERIPNSVLYDPAEVKLAGSSSSTLHSANFR